MMRKAELRTVEMGLGVLALGIAGTIGVYEKDLAAAENDRAEAYAKFDALEKQLRELESQEAAKADEPDA